MAWFKGKWYGSTVLFIVLVITVNYSCIYAAGTDINWEQLKKKNRGIIDREPENIMAGFELAISLANTGEIEKSYNLFSELGERVSPGKFQKIIKPYLDKLKKNKNDILLLNYAAFNEVVLDNYRRAIEYFRRLEKLEPENVWMLNYMASCYIEIGKYEEAEKIINRAQAIKDTEFSHLLLGWLHYERGSLLNALLEFAKSGSLFKALMSEVK